jgi:hypothetical protein
VLWFEQLLLQEIAVAAGVEMIRKLLYANEKKIPWHVHLLK